MIIPRAGRPVIQSRTLNSNSLAVRWGGLKADDKEEKKERHKYSSGRVSSLLAGRVCASQTPCHAEKGG